MDIVKVKDTSDRLLLLDFILNVIMGKDVSKKDMQVLLDRRWETAEHRDVFLFIRELTSKRSGRSEYLPFL